MRIVVDKHGAAHLVDTVEQGVPVKHCKHSRRQGVCDEHLARGDHIGARKDSCRHANETRRPRLCSQEDQSDCNSGEPSKQQDAQCCNGFMNYKWIPESVVDEKDNNDGQNLNVKRNQQYKLLKLHYSCLH